jgi:hypothetical protein
VGLRQLTTPPTSNYHRHSTKKNVPSTDSKNVHNKELVHSNKKRKYIKKEQIKEIAENKYQRNGQGITFEDIMYYFTIKKQKAQRTLKHFRMKKLLFTAEDIKKQNIYLKGLDRENPQRYYLTDMKARVIESKRNNVQIDTTGYGSTFVSSSLSPSSLSAYSSSHSSSPPFSYIDQQKAQHVQDILYRLSSVHLYIHKLQIQTCINKEYYDDIKDIKPDLVNGAKIYEQRIGQSQGHPNLKFIISPNGTVMIYVSCSMNPFRLYDEQDVSDILIFLGRVEENLCNLFSDTRDMIIPSVKKWILKGCDVNKDVEINSVAQLTLPDIQIPLFERAVKGYVKLIGDRAYYRIEQSLTPNEPINISLEKLRTQIKLDQDILSL